MFLRLLDLVRLFLVVDSVLLIVVVFIVGLGADFFALAHKRGRGRGHYWALFLLMLFGGVDSVDGKDEGEDHGGH